MCHEYESCISHQTYYGYISTSRVGLGFVGVWGFFLYLNIKFNSMVKNDSHSNLFLCFIIK